MTATAHGPVLHMAMELSNSKWKLGFEHGEKHRYVTVQARDVVELAEAMGDARARFGLGPDVAMVSCYEAGRDGFWLHRWLEHHGVKNLVVDAASIEVERRSRRRKTDRLDLKKLLSSLVRFFTGEKGVWSVVRVPSADVEDARRDSRERDRLIKERGGHCSRIRSLMVMHGISLGVSAKFLEELESVRRWNGCPIPARLKHELVREYERWELANSQIVAIDRARRERMKIKRDELPRVAAQAVDLQRLKGIGVCGAWKLSHEFFWRDFRNPKQVGGCLGMTGTPYDSGGMVRDQGISKVGNRAVRGLAVELAWGWLRHQPESKISKWFAKRCAPGHC